jgi:hypothetical protein
MHRFFAALSRDVITRMRQMSILDLFERVTHRLRPREVSCRCLQCGYHGELIIYTYGGRFTAFAKARY